MSAGYSVRFGHKLRNRADRFYGQPYIGHHTFCADMCCFIRCAFTQHSCEACPASLSRRKSPTAFLTVTKMVGDTEPHTAHKCYSFSQIFRKIDISFLRNLHSLVQQQLALDIRTAEGKAGSQPSLSVNHPVTGDLARSGIAVKRHSNRA